MNDIIIYFLLLVNAIMSSFSQVILKKSAMREYNSILFQYLNPYVITGYSIFFLVLMLNIMLLKYLSVSVVSVFSEAIPIIISLFFGLWFFNEKIGNKKIIASILIIAGIILIII